MTFLKMGLLTCAALTLGVASYARAAAPDNIITAYTAPMQKNVAKPGFRQQGIVREIFVRKGDHVKKGQVLIQLDDSVEVNQWESLRIQANSNLQELAAKAEMEEKKVELKRFENLVKTQASSPLERDRAALEVEIAQKKMEIAHEEQLTKQFDAAARKAQIEQMKIVAPFDGEVQDVTIGLGDLTSNDASKSVIEIVQRDPVDVVMNLANSQANLLQIGDRMQVRYGEKGSWMDATVYYIAPAADAKSFTRMVSLEMSNPSGMAPGQEVQVKLPDKLVEEQRTASAK